MKALGVEANEIDIRPSCMQMLKDIGHPFAEGKTVYDITFENIQAGERTSHLFRIANLRNALVVGTGDLSELALGWCTYGVGDHMSHYNVNASVPKTLIQHLIRWVARSEQFSPEASADPPRHPRDRDQSRADPGRERRPALPEDGSDTSGHTSCRISTSSIRPASAICPTKIAFMAYCAWRDNDAGTWPDVPEAKRHDYTIGEIRHWLEVYLYRFFQISQFKRSCVPNGPKVGSGGSLSPRGDYRAPSDSEAAVWLEDAKGIPERDER